MPTKLLTENNPEKDTSSAYMADFACRCAQEAKKEGWSVFGLQALGELSYTKFLLIFFFYLLYKVYNSKELLPTTYTYTNTYYK